MTLNPEQEENLSMGNIERVARSLSQGITPMTLFAEKKVDEARELQEAIDRITEGELMDVVQERIKELRVKESPTTPKFKKPRKYSHPPRQIYMEEAHPGGYDGMWQIQLPEREEGPSAVFDPERGINKMHYRKRLFPSHIIIQDSNWLRRQLSFWKLTGAEERQRAEESIRRSVQYLKKAGVWEILEKGFSYRDRLLIHEIIANYKEPIRDLDSSGGFTIYPNEASWTREVYGYFDDE